MATAKQKAHRTRFARQARAGTGKIGKAAKSTANVSRKRRTKKG